MESYTRTSKTVDLPAYCHLSEESDFIELTEWFNDEGTDIVMHTNSIGQQKFAITYGQLDALIVAYLSKE